MSSSTSSIGLRLTRWEGENLDRAWIRIRYGNRGEAVAVAEAVAVDNRQAPRGLRLDMEVVDTVVVTCVESECRLETFVATLDDLLRGIQVAEATLVALRMAG